MSKGIKLTSEQIQFLYENSDYDGGFRSGGEILEGFERWWIQADIKGLQELGVEMECY